MTEEINTGDQEGSPPSLTEQLIKEQLIKEQLIKDHFIKCPRFGGSRLSLACVHFDRYRSCRRTCNCLREHIKSHPDLLEISTKEYKVKESLMTAKFSGKNLSNPELRCKHCDFEGRSALGLKMHIGRRHKEFIIKKRLKKHAEIHKNSDG